MRINSFAQWNVSKSSNSITALFSRDDLGSIWPDDFAGQTRDLHINPKKNIRLALHY
jgi:hypothetical protein